MKQTSGFELETFFKNIILATVATLIAFYGAYEIEVFDKALFNMFSLPSKIELESLDSQVTFRLVYGIDQKKIELKPLKPIEDTDKELDFQLHLPWNVDSDELAKYIKNSNSFDKVKNINKEFVSDVLINVHHVLDSQKRHAKLTLVYFVLFLLFCFFLHFKLIKIFKKKRTKGFLGEIFDPPIELLEWSKSQALDGPEGLSAVTERLVEQATNVQIMLTKFLFMVENNANINQLNKKIDVELINGIKELKGELILLQNLKNNIILGHKKPSEVLSNINQNTAKVNFVGSLEYLAKDSRELEEIFEKLGERLANDSGGTRLEFNLLLVEPVIDPQWNVDTEPENKSKAFVHKAIDSMLKGLEKKNKLTKKENKIKILWKVKAINCPYPISFLTIDDRYLYLSLISHSQWERLLREEYPFGILVNMEDSDTSEIVDEKRELVRASNGHFERLFNPESYDELQKDRVKLIELDHKYYKSSNGISLRDCSPP